MTPFMGQIACFAFNFAPKGWALCNGQTLPIQQNQALFSLLGTTYGGNGVQTFALPNYQGRTPIHREVRSGFSYFGQGQAGGAESHTLLSTEMPSHTHNVIVSDAIARANLLSPDNALLAIAPNPLYSDGSGASLEANSTGLPSTSVAGGNQAHTNLQPYLTLNFCIALQGIFPSRN